MENFKYALDGAWQVLLAGLVLGVGLPTIFALGVRSLAIGSGGAGAAGTSTDVGPSVLGKVLAAICFVVVVAAIAIGITIIIAQGLGKDVSFSHGYPTIVPKAS